MGPVAPMNDASPEAIAGKWASLETLANQIGDAETRDRYLTEWRHRFDAAFPVWLRDSEIVHLPDWKHVGEISARERRQAKRVSDEWGRSAAVSEDFDAQKRFAWDIGRRVAIGLVDDAIAGETLLIDRLGAAATARGIMDAFKRGCRDVDAGEGLLAAIVLDLRCALIPRSDMGLAERFSMRFGQDFRHTTAKGWVKWDGKRWRVLDEEKGVVPAELLAAAFATVRAIQREADAVAATGLAEGSIPEGANPWRFSVEGADGKVKLVDLAMGKVPRDEDGAIAEGWTLVEALEELESPEGIDGLVTTASTCRLLSVVLSRFGRASEEARRIRAIPDLARRWLTVKIQDFDTDPMVINCQNGTLRLKREVDGEGRVQAHAELSPHERTDLLTKIANVDYDPDALCPNYDATIAWAQPKPEMRRYLHQWGGYNLTGDMGAQIFHIWWGPLAQNGKSTILDAWANCAGDYADAGKIETFMEAAHAKGGDAATPALARLPGVRMLRTGEPPANAKFDESLINQITGQDTLQIRDNFRSFFAVLLQIKVTVACNAPPSIPNATEGIKRRVKVVPFEQTMKGAKNPDGTPKRDENFKAKLVPEMPGIFARLVEGACDWLEHGFLEPDDVTQWTEEYKDENDPLGRFIAYCTEPDQNGRVQSSKLYELFAAWSKATGGPDWTQTYFTKKMKGKGFSDKRSNGIQWLGLKQVREVGDFVDGEGKVRDLSGSDAFAGGAASARANAAADPDDPPDWGASDDPGGLPPDFDDDDPFAPPSK